ncbi:Cys/Met metabolism PLP-dependent enzyme-domain-containing protein [Ilyonectria destructans]|nr:Cys/Met metabolism PLP-dependent enzyme-domain-containing protein [Ilyonectria destructans]
MNTSNNHRQAPEYAGATLALHADDDAIDSLTDVTPPIHMTTTFLFPEERERLAENERGVSHMYARYSSPNTSRLEAILSSLLHGHVVSYNSGLAAFNALVTYFRPNVIAIGVGYYGSHKVIDIHRKMYNVKKVDLFDEASWDDAGLGKGDIVHVETPLNPSGEAVDLDNFAAKAQKRGALLTVDATFGPPGLQDPFRHGADVVMHSGSKYLGGHSDVLCGVLAVRNAEWHQGLLQERSYLGSVLGAMDSWLVVRSVRTLEVRVQREWANAKALVQWLDDALSRNGDEAIRHSLEQVQHASIQNAALQDGWLKKQMPNGYGPVFAMWMKRREDAERFPKFLKLFHHAVSLGGVESLIEWRWKSDKSVDPRLIRVSVGLENVEDLRRDMTHAFQKLVESSP